MHKIIMLVLLAEFGIVIGQLYLKKSVNNLERHSGRSLSATLFFLRKLVVTPTFLTGIFSMAVGLLFWIAALSVGDLSIVYPLGSMQYIFILFASRFFLGEGIDWAKLVGTALVTLGIIFISMS